MLLMFRQGRGTTVPTVKHNGGSIMLWMRQCFWNLELVTVEKRKICDNFKWKLQAVSSKTVSRVVLLLVLFNTTTKNIRWCWWRTPSRSWFCLSGCYIKMKRLFGIFLSGHLSMRQTPSERYVLACMKPWLGSRWKSVERTGDHGQRNIKSGGDERLNKEERAGIAQEACVRLAENNNKVLQAAVWQKGHTSRLGAGMKKCRKIFKGRV